MNVLLFGTGTGLYHDNSKYLFEFYLKEKVHYKLYWVANNEVVYNKLKKSNLNVVKKNSLMAAFLASCAKSYFITAEIFDVFYFVNPKTTVIQLWHGTPIKKIGYDTNLYSKNLAKKKYFGFNYTYDRFDFFIIEDDSYKNIFQSSFRLNEKKMIPLGQIRNSILLEPCKNRIFDLKKLLGIDNFNKIVIYVPTFRDNVEMNAAILESFLSEKTTTWLETNNIVLLVKLHPLLVNGQISNSKEFLRCKLDHKNIIDLSFYDDIQELLLISDILITDYSSVAFDFAILNRPIYLFQPDLEEYERLRDGFYFTFKKLLELAEKIDAIEEVDLTIPFSKVEYSYRIKYERFLELI